MDKIDIASDDTGSNRFGCALSDFWRRAVEAPRARRIRGMRADIHAPEPTPLSIRGRVTTVLSYEDSF